MSGKALFVLVVAGLALAGAIAVFFTLAPLPALQSLLPLSDLDGSLTNVDQVAAAALRRAASAAALSVAIAIAVVFSLRRRVETALETSAQQVRAFVSLLLSELRSWYASNTSEVVALSALVVAGAVLRWVLIESPIRYDEAHTFLRWARRSWLDVISDYRQPNNHVFHTIWVHLSYKLFGSGLAALRAPAFLAGILTIPACFALARRVFDGRAAIVAAALEHE